MTRRLNFAAGLVVTVLVVGCASANPPGATGVHAATAAAAPPMITQAENASPVAAAPFDAAPTAVAPSDAVTPDVPPLVAQPIALGAPPAIDAQSRPAAEGSVLVAVADAVVAPLTVGSSTNDILDALDDVGRGLKDFTAKVALTDNDVATDLTTKRTGQVWLTNGDSAKVRVTFDHKINGKKLTDERLDYLLADGRLTDRNSRNKVETKRQVLKPGQKVNLLKLGEGPFPLPIGQKRDDVLANFTVKKVPPDPTDAKNAVHLELTPKADSSFARKFKSIDVWVDLATHMPARIATLDKAETTMRTTDLSDIKLNGEVKDSDFVLPKLEGDWQSNEEPFKD